MILPPREHTIPSIPTAEVVLMAAKRNVISKESERREPCARPSGSLPNEPNIDIAGEPGRDDTARNSLATKTDSATRLTVFSTEARR